MSNEMKDRLYRWFRVIFPTGNDLSDSDYDYEYVESSLLEKLEYDELILPEADKRAWRNDCLKYDLKHALSRLYHDGYQSRRASKYLLEVLMVNSNLKPYIMEELRKFPKEWVDDYVCLGFSGFFMESRARSESLARNNRKWEEADRGHEKAYNRIMSAGVEGLVA